MSPMEKKRKANTYSVEFRDSAVKLALEAVWQKFFDVCQEVSFGEKSSKTYPNGKNSVKEAGLEYHPSFTQKIKPYLYLYPCNNLKIDSCKVRKNFYQTASKVLDN
jgi:hypothetical protein